MQGPLQSPEVWLSLVDSLMSQRLYDEAVGALVAALQQHPHHPRLRSRYRPLDPLWGAALTTSHIRLRPWACADEAFLLRCFNTTEFMQRFHRFAAPARNPDVLRRHLSNAGFPVVKYRAVHWIIEHLTQDDAQAKRWHPIGLADLTDINLRHARAELIIGLVDPASRGHAHALTATLLLLEYAFNRMQLHKLTSLVYGDNPLAQRNTLALGFIQEGIRREHLRDPETGAWLDTFENGLLANNYRNNLRLQRLRQRLLCQRSQTPPLHQTGTETAALKRLNIKSHTTFSTGTSPTA